MNKWLIFLFTTGNGRFLPSAVHKMMTYIHSQTDACCLRMLDFQEKPVPSQRGYVVGCENDVTYSTSTSGQACFTRWSFSMHGQDPGVEETHPGVYMYRWRRSDPWEKSDSFSDRETKAAASNSR